MVRSCSALLLFVSLLACGEDAPPPIGDATGGIPRGGSGGSGGSGVGAPGDPNTGAFYKVGDALDPSLSWKGYSAGSDELGTLTLADFHDPTGAKGIRALLITEGQAGCTPCLSEAKDLSTNLPGRWKDSGIAVVQLVVADVNGNAATEATTLAWKNKINASWAVGVDARFTFAQAGSNPYPVQVIVDPRTLTIVDRLEGYREQLPELEALAEKNQ